MSRKYKFFLTAFLLILPILWFTLNLFQNNLENLFYAQISQPLLEIQLARVDLMPKKPRLDLQVKSAISLKINRLGKKKILYQKNTQEVLPIASLTKLMTALIIFEDPSYNIEKTWITISKTAANQEDVPNYGNLKEGEGFNVNKLLELMLIYSSNDAALALSEYINLERFIEKMNQKTLFLGLRNTHFVNSTGLDLEGSNCNLDNFDCFNYSTAKDLIELAQYIFKKQSEIFNISLRRGSYLVFNGISSFSEPENLEILGGKTGFTNKAGGCVLLVLGDKKDNVFINVILGASSPKKRIEEMQKLINWLAI